jgi:hypothetical protein
MKLDRDIQRQILEKLHETYPNGIYPLAATFGQDLDEEVVIANTQYLHEHGLVQSGFRDRELIGQGIAYRWAEPRETFITAKGVDFLLDDGGLSAILGVVTVKLDSSTIKALVLSKIDQAEDVSHEERSRLKSLLLSAGDQGMRKLVDTLIEAGLKAAPNSGQLIGMLQGLLA